VGCPIFEADLPPKQDAYRPGRNAQHAVTEVGALPHRGHPEVVDADLADYFMKSRDAPATAETTICVNTSSTPAEETFSRASRSDRRCNGHAARTPSVEP
jgi:hypothetical protein